MLGAGRTPLLLLAELGRFGFSMAIYGISLLMHATRVMQGVLADLACGGVGFDRWSRIKAAHRWRGSDEGSAPIRMPPTRRA